jgi:hypothetical protein
MSVEHDACMWPGTRRWGIGSLQATKQAERQIVTQLKWRCKLRIDGLEGQGRANVWQANRRRQWSSIVVGVAAVTGLALAACASSGGAGAAPSPATSDLPNATMTSSAPGSNAQEPATNLPTASSPSTTSPIEETGAPEVPPTATRPSTPPAGRSANADVLHVRAVQTADDTWTFHVTVRHPDIGWEDYADGWDVLTPDGKVIKPDPESTFTRLLLHPHENEQPFTRSQSGIIIPPDVTQVRVRAHDLVDGYGGREVIVDLTVSSGPDFEVERKS